jgi:predicted protein tyrosine phosphatase
MLRSREAGGVARSVTLAAQALADAETLGLTGLADDLRTLARQPRPESHGATCRDAGDH